MEERRKAHRGKGGEVVGNRQLEDREHAMGVESGQRKHHRHHDGRSSHVEEEIFSCSGHHHVLGCSHEVVRGGHSSRQQEDLRSHDHHGLAESAICSGHVEGAYEGSRTGSVRGLAYDAS